MASAKPPRRQVAPNSVCTTLDPHIDYACSAINCKTHCTLNTWFLVGGGMAVMEKPTVKWVYTLMVRYFLVPVILKWETYF